MTWFEVGQLRLDPDSLLGNADESDSRRGTVARERSSFVKLWQSPRAALEPLIGIKLR
jgi:hypothetical protein